MRNPSLQKKLEMALIGRKIQAFAVQRPAETLAQ
jgi:hypothetical protein